MKLIAFGLVALLTFGAAFFIALVLAIPVMLAWNYAVPEVFHLQHIGLMQAFCLTFLAATFFKGASASASSSR